MFGLLRRAAATVLPDSVYAIFFMDDADRPKLRLPNGSLVDFVGPQGIQGIQGVQGVQGIQGFAGWSPILSVHSDGTRRVLKLEAWTGGEGTAPTEFVGQYLSASGFTAVLANAIDVRGPQGIQGEVGPPAALSDNNPLALGTATPGTSVLVSREDHVHPMPSAAQVGADPAGTGAAQAASAYSAAIQRGNHTGTQSADTLTDGSTNRLFSTAEKNKLAGVATGATANATDAQLRDRSTHTGTQLASTISDFASTALGTLLTGLSTATNAIITATDSILVALGKLQKQITDNLATLTGHTGNTSNPHSTTAAQVGLGNVPNVDARARSTHTGTQLASTISDLNSAIDTQTATNRQPLDATLTALAGANWALNSVLRATGPDTVVQQAIAANQFMARASTGDWLPKSITDAGLNWVSAADIAAMTAQLNAATTALKGLMSAADKRKLNGLWIDVVAEHGADPTGAASSQAAIEAAIAALPAGGGVIFFPPGSYLHTATITVNKPVIFMGAGRAITNISINHATQDQFDFVTGSQCAGFEQIRLTGLTPTTRTGGVAVDFNAIPNLYMQQCDILYHHTAVRSNGPLQFLDDLNIREGGANAANGQAILVEGFGDRYVRRITTDQGSDPTGYAGIRVRECASLVLTDCNLINSTNALDIVPNGGAGKAVASIMATGNFFDSSVIGVNILPATASDTAHRIRFVNCWFGSNTAANVRIGNGTIPNQNIATIDIIGCEFFGGSVSALGLDVLGATDWSVRGSRFGGHTTRAIQVAVGAGAADHRFSITDNVIGNVLGGGTNAQGIQVGAGTYGNYQILDNRGLDQNTTPGIIDLGSVGPTGFKNVKNNMGCLMGGAQQLVNSGGAAVIGGRGAVTSGTGETLLFAVRIPANAVSVGQTFRINMRGRSSSTGTLRFQIRVGAAGTVADTLVWQQSAASAAQVANAISQLTGLVTVAALGATNTVAVGATAQHQLVFFNEAAAAEILASAPTTAPWYISVTATCSAGTFTVNHVAVTAE